MNNDLTPPPEPWRVPRQELQGTLFPEKAKQLLAQSHVSADDAMRWRDLGWLSFDPRKLPDMDRPQFYELIFVRNIARSGLSDEQVDSFLNELPKPFSYSPTLTAYSFAYGWVHCPPGESFEVIIDEYVNDWVREQASLGNRKRLMALIAFIIKTLPEDGDDEKDEE